MPQTFATATGGLNVATGYGQSPPEIFGFAEPATYVVVPFMPAHIFPIAVAPLDDLIGAGETIIVTTWEDDLVAQLALQAVPTSRTTVYTVPADRNAIIRFIDFINDTASPITVHLWIDGVKIVPSKSVGANDVFSRNGIWDIGPGDIIEAQASGAGANLSISGVLELTA